MSRAYEKSDYVYEQSTLDWATESKDADMLITLSMTMMVFCVVVGAGLVWVSTQQKGLNQPR